MISYFAFPDSFSAVPRASAPVFMFCASGLVFGGTMGVESRFQRCGGRRLLFSCFTLPDLFSAVPTTSCPVFMFCHSEHVFGGGEGVGSRFHILRAQTHFRRYRGRRVQFSCFALSDSFSTVPRASGPTCFGRPNSFSVVPRSSGPVFMFCPPGLIFGGTDGVGSRFHVLRSRNHLRRYRGRWDPLPCFALPDSFSAVPRASDPVFMFCATEIVLRYRGRRVRISYFAFPDSFSAVPRASALVFMFCAPGLVFDGTVGVGSRFHVLRSQTRFQRCGGRRLLFSCFALPDSFSAVPTASCPVFMFCPSEHVFDGSEGVGSRFHVLRSRTRFRRCAVHRVRFHVLRARTRFRRYRGRLVWISCFAFPDLFSAVPRASAPVFMFCAP
jgi:hypothetical protein